MDRYSLQQLAPGLCSSGEQDLCIRVFVGGWLTLEAL